MAVRTTSQPCTRENLSNHPKEAEPNLPEIQAHHPGKDVTLATGTSLADSLNAPPTGTTGPHPIVFPTVLPTAVPAVPTITAMIDATGDPHPSIVTRTALR